MLAAAFAGWQELIDPLLHFSGRVWDVLPRRQAPEPDLAAALAQLEAAAGAIPGRLRRSRRPRRRCCRSRWRSRASTPRARTLIDVSNALSQVLTIAIEQWDERLADAQRMAAAAERFLHRTGEHEDDLRGRLAAGLAALTRLRSCPRCRWSSVKSSKTRAP